MESQGDGYFRPRSRGVTYFYKRDDSIPSRFRELVAEVILEGINSSEIVRALHHLMSDLLSEPAIVSTALIASVILVYQRFEIFSPPNKILITIRWK